MASPYVNYEAVEAIALIMNGHRKHIKSRLTYVPHSHCHTPIWRARKGTRNPECHGFFKKPGPPAQHALRTAHECRHKDETRNEVREASSRDGQRLVCLISAYRAREATVSTVLENGASLCGGAGTNSVSGEPDAGASALGREGDRSTLPRRMTAVARVGLIICGNCNVGAAAGGLPASTAEAAPAFSPVPVAPVRIMTSPPDSGDEGSGDRDTRDDADATRGLEPIAAGRDGGSCVVGVRIVGLRELRLGGGGMLGASPAAAADGRSGSVDPRALWGTLPGASAAAA
jgi:hypothetical protein